MLTPPLTAQGHGTFWPLCSGNELFRALVRVFLLAASLPLAPGNNAPRLVGRALTIRGGSSAKPAVFEQEPTTCNVPLGYASESEKGGAVAEVGACKAPPLRVAPAPGDVVVGRGDHCNCTALVEAVWDVCWASRNASGGRVYVRTGQQSWNGQMAIPANRSLQVVGPTSAQLCGHWLLHPASRGTFTGIAAFWGDPDSSKATFDILGGVWRFEHAEVTAAAIDVAHLSGQARVQLHQCVVGGMDDTHRRAAAGVLLSERARCQARGCTLANILGAAVALQDTAAVEVRSTSVHRAGLALTATNRSSAALHQVLVESSSTFGAPAIVLAGACEAVVDRCVFRAAPSTAPRPTAAVVAASGGAGVVARGRARVALRACDTSDLATPAIKFEAGGAGNRDTPPHQGGQVEVSNCRVRGAVWSGADRPGKVEERGNNVML
jgi:hypothetical protein